MSGMPMKNAFCAPFVFAALLAGVRTTSPGTSHMAKTTEVGTPAAASQPGMPVNQ